MAKKPKERTAADIASELLECRKALAEWKTIEKPLAEELKKRIKKGEQQSLYEISVSSSFKVGDMDKALNWANKFAKETITVDTRAARDKFLQDIATGSMGTPESNGFAFKETEKLTAVGESEE